MDQPLPTREEKQKRILEKARQNAASEGNFLEALVKSTEFERHEGQDILDEGEDIEDSDLFNGFLEVIY